MSPRSRQLAQLLDGPSPEVSLRAAIENDLASGLRRETVLGDLEDLRLELATEGEADREEIVLSVMNDVVGFCSPLWRSMARLGLTEFEDPEPEGSEMEHPDLAEPGAG